MENIEKAFDEWASDGLDLFNNFVKFVALVVPDKSGDLLEEVIFGVLEQDHAICVDIGMAIIFQPTRSQEIIIQIV